MHKTKLKALGQGRTTQTANEVKLGNPGQTKPASGAKRFQLTICISVLISLWQPLRLTKKYICIFAWEVLACGCLKASLLMLINKLPRSGQLILGTQAHELKEHYQKAEERMHSTK